ncbi:MAG: carbonic anhydrase family protein [Rhodoplanes sp.]
MLALFAASAAGQESYNYADPRNWGGECQTGAQQSPVDLTTSNGVYDAPYDAASNTPFLRYWYYPPFPLTLKNTGTTMEIIAPPNGGKIALNGRAYQLDQIHWHHPAEHGFFDLNPDLEVHLVHKDERGNLLVLALFLAARGDDDHPSLEPVIQRMGSIPVGAEVPFAGVMFDALPLTGGVQTTYIYYTGSKTTPPCNSNVTWVVRVIRDTMSQRQLAAIKAKFPKNNARPLQPANGRRFPLCCDGLPSIPYERVIQAPF